MKMKFFVARLILFLLCSSSSFLLPHGNAYASDPLRVGYLPILDHLTLVVSCDRDSKSFKDIAIEMKMFKRWDEMAGALKGGVIDAAFILSPLAMDLFNSGVDVKTILLGHRNGSAITVKKGSGMQSARDLMGKTISIPDRKSTHVALLDKYLRGEGLSLQDVNVTVIAPPNMEEAMKLGKIDAFIVAEPFGAKAESNGVGEILVLTKEIIDNHVECIVIVKNQFLQENQSGVQEWVDSLIRAGKFIEKDKQTNNANVVAGIAKKYMGHDEQVTRNGLQKPPDRIIFGDLNPAVSAFQRIVNISRQAGIIKNVRLESFIDDRFYRKSAYTN